MGESSSDTCDGVFVLEERVFVFLLLAVVLSHVVVAWGVAARRNGDGRLWKVRREARETVSSVVASSRRRISRAVAVSASSSGGFRRRAERNGGPRASERYRADWKQRAIGAS